MNVESAGQIARALAGDPQLETLSLSFHTRLSAAVIKTLFDVPALQRLSEIELHGGTPPAVWDRFFASPYVRNVKRLAIGGEHAAGFARAPWPQLERLEIGIDGDARDRKALAKILATAMPRLTALELESYGLGFGIAGVELVVGSVVFPRLVSRCAEHILALGKDAGEAAQRSVLKRCITGFNRFSDRIYTIEAEHIVEAFEAVARYTKLESEDLADEWRDF
ncbi:MAG: hypothetical protein ABI867_22190 [Kofleriaceae bacterium]